MGDGCTDDSERVVTAIGDRRVQWVNLERTGHQVGPNNEGLRRARGAVVAYLGHDDLWLPNHLEVLMGAFDAGATAAHTSVFRAGPGRPCFVAPEPGWSYTRGARIPPTSFATRRSQAVEVGGWRDATKTGYLDPECDFLARVCDVAGPPTWVPRLTCVKLNAIERHNVYRDRPTHEQAYWLAQIREADDPERAIGAHVGRPYHLAGDRVAPLGLHTRVAFGAVPAPEAARAEYPGEDTDPSRATLQGCAVNLSRVQYQRRTCASSEPTRSPFTSAGAVNRRIALLFPNDPMRWYTQRLVAT